MGKTGKRRDPLFDLRDVEGPVMLFAKEDCGQNRKGEILKIPSSDQGVIPGGDGERLLQPSLRRVPSPMMIPGPGSSRSEPTKTEWAFVLESHSRQSSWAEFQTIVVEGVKRVARWSFAIRY
jgi:hypothetical protein